MDLSLTILAIFTLTFPLFVATHTPTMNDEADTDRQRLIRSIQAQVAEWQRVEIEALTLAHGQADPALEAMGKDWRN